MANPPLDVKRSGPGRPRAEGERYPGGKLRSPALTDEQVRRRAALKDTTWGDNPLYAAFSARWLEQEDYEAAKAYLALRRRATYGMGGPKLALSTLPEVAQQDLVVSGDRVLNWSRRQIVEVWDTVFDEEGADLEVVERRREESARQIRAIHAALSDAERSELHAVCVQESWPQWFVQRMAGEAISLRAKSEDRGMTDEEMAKRRKRFTSPFEAKRDLLIRALRIIRRVMKPDVVVHDAAAFDAPLVEPVPFERSEDQRGFERTDYVDRHGEQVFVLERKRQA